MYGKYKEKINGKFEIKTMRKIVVFKWNCKTIKTKWFENRLKKEISKHGDGFNSIDITTGLSNDDFIKDKITVRLRFYNSEYANLDNYRNYKHKKKFVFYGL